MIARIAQFLDRRPGLLAAIVGAVVFCAYANSLDGDLVVDDVYFIKESPLIRDLSSAADIFTSAFWESSSRPGKSYYRPLVVLSHALNYKAGGTNPFGYHLVNAAIHVANSLLVFFLLALLCREGAVERRPSEEPRAGANALLAATAGLLWGLHPLNTESVAWISGRTDLLASFFSLLAMVIHVRRLPPMRGANAGAGDGAPAASPLAGVPPAVCVFLALLCKESAILVPGVLIAYEAAFRNLRREDLPRLLPLALAIVAYLLGRSSVLGGLQTGTVYFAANPLVTEGALPKLLTGIVIFGEYLWRLILPVSLSIDYSYNEIPVARTLLDWRVAASGLAAVLLGTATALSFRREPRVFFGLALFGITGALIFANALFPYAPIMAERFMYLPSVGLVIAVVVAASRAVGLLSHAQAPLAVALAMMVSIPGFFALTLARNAEWSSELSLFESAVKVNQNSSIAYLGLANEYYRLGRFAEAKRAYEQALGIYPEFGFAKAGLGNVALSTRDYAAAVVRLEEAVALLPQSDEMHRNLGAAYGTLGRFDEALSETRKALALNPASSETNNNLGNIHLMRGEVSEALARWEKAAELNPYNAEAVYNLAYSYGEAGREEESRHHYRRFLEIAPDGLAEVKARVRDLLRE